MPWSMMYVKLAAAAFMLTASFGLGWEWRDRSADAELLHKEAEISAILLELQHQAIKASESAREIERLTRERVALVDEANALRNQERETAERIVTREVVRYVQSPDAGRLVLPAEWVRIHDIAAFGRGAGVPGTAFPASRAYADAGRITDADAIAVTTENYATCHAVRDQLLALQGWVRAAVVSQ